jgi:adenylate kinase
MTERGPRLVLIGKQGAGKGTQASRLAEHYDVAHISTGDLFRDAIRDQTPLGQQVQEYMDRGNLVPDDIVIRVVEDRFKGDPGLEDGFVLDGFPRTERQADELERVLTGKPLDLVVDLDVPTEIVLRRIAGRRVCEGCGATYHVDSPPKENWTCDECGGKVTQREDDTEDAVLRRLDLYEKETLPLIQFYRRAGKLAHADGTRESDEVFKALVELVDERCEPCRSDGQ